MDAAFASTWSIVFGVDDAILLPHAVDDRCETVDQFWTGSIDQGCVAWMAHLAWLYVRFTGDTAVLDDIAWPLLTGAFGGFYAMLEEEEDCGVEREEGAEQPLRRRLYLPVSVSPEYNGVACRPLGPTRRFNLLLYTCSVVCFLWLLSVAAVQ